MSQMKNTVVMRCKRCGRPVYVTHLSTMQEDPEMELLQVFIQNLQKLALCQDCIAAKNYYAKIGRYEDWEAGRP